MEPSLKHCIFFSLVAIYLCEGRFVNKDVQRLIDLRTNLVKDSYKITVDLIGEMSEPYSFVIPSAICKNKAFMSVRNEHNNDLHFKEKISDYGCEYLFELNKTSVLFIDTVYSKLLIPHPKDIPQSGKQLIKYSGNIYYFSHYKTAIQKAILQLPSENIVYHSQLKPVSVSNKVITYGPYENIKELSIYSLDIHYENQFPFLTVTHLERKIEVSHWGNIAVEESINLIHSGAKLKGPFSRYELQKDIRSEQSVIKSYKTVLPAAATSVYYRDSNGNISTSDIKIIPDAVELELRPRFSLFGGWKTNYILGYNVPSFEYLYNQDQTFLLKMRVIDHIYDDMNIEEATVKIILPEGSTRFELITPFPVESKSNEVFYSYLDTIGRPVISFSKQNLVENHINDFSLKYTFPKLLMVQEPLLLVGFIFSLFVLVVLFIRLDFSLSREYHSHYD